MWIYACRNLLIRHRRSKNSAKTRKQILGFAQRSAEIFQAIIVGTLIEVIHSNCLSVCRLPVPQSLWAFFVAWWTTVVLMALISNCVAKTPNALQVQLRLSFNDRQTSRRVNSFISKSGRSPHAHLWTWKCFLNSPADDLTFLRPSSVMATFGRSPSTIFRWKISRLVFAAVEGSK